MEALLFLFFSFSIAEKETKNLELLLGDCFAPRIALFFMRLLPVGQTQIQTAIHYHLQTVHVDVTSFLINMFSIETEVEIRITIINPQNPIL